ncbi:hypothetical protein ACVIHH_008497 [Bradyrhizobium sp. USDA 4518]
MNLYDGGMQLSASLQPRLQLVERHRGCRHR